MMRAPFALTESGARGVRIVAANQAAARVHVRVGMALTDARARCGELRVQPVARDGDARALAALTAWHRRYSPLVAAYGGVPDEREARAHRDAVMLDVTGCAHLLGGEADLLADMARRLKAAGLKARLALADTPGAAWAGARYGPRRAGGRWIIPPGQTAAHLQDLPVEALRLTAKTVQRLRRFGLTTIGQLAPMPRATLARRFSSRTAAEAVVRRLDEALGRRAEPFTPDQPAPRHSVCVRCREPVLQSQGLRAGLRQALQQLCARLARFDVGARTFVFTAFRVDGSVARLRAAVARPSRDPAHLARLFDHHWERLDPGFGVDAVALAALNTAPLNAAAPCLGASWAGGRDGEALARLADRLAARLGRQAVGRIQPVDSHIPERSEMITTFGEDTAETAGDMASAWGRATQNAQRGPRPMRLLARPEPVIVMAEAPDGPPVRFTWRRVMRRVRRASGPERVSPEWWRTGGEAGADPPDGAGAPVDRDYYVVEDDAGCRYWLRRDGHYVDAAPPRWFVQGLFS